MIFGRNIQNTLRYFLCPVWRRKVD